MALPDTCGIDRFGWMDFLEAQTRIIRISLEMQVRFASVFLHLLGELIETLPKGTRYVGFHSCSGLSGFVRPFVMFLQRFVSEPGQLISRTSEGFVPSTFRFQLSKQPFRQFVLFFPRELNCLCERFFEKLGHSGEFTSLGPSLQSG